MSAFEIKQYLSSFFTDEPTTIRPVSGGDIGRSYQLEAPTSKFFIKHYPQIEGKRMASTEAGALNFLAQNTPFTIPKTLYPELLDQGIIAMQWMEEKEITAHDWQTFGRNLAKMHLVHGHSFGWKEDNFMGTQPQKNKPFSSWAAFYTQQRIYPLISKLVERAPEFPHPSVEGIEQRIKDEYPEESPSLLHGDLWSGNKMMTQNGFSLYDPAIYFGHREIDLAMTQLFGGFDPSFIDSYQEIYPLESGWRSRLPLTQLYPLLVHAVLFGGGYIDTCKTIIKKNFH